MISIQLTEEQIAAITVKDKSSDPKPKRTKIDSPDEAYKQFKHLGELTREHCIALTLDSRNQLISKHEVSVGTVEASLLHPRELFRQAILDNASAIVLAHNHPSGNTNPSDEDCLITKRLRTAGKIVGITIGDHLIIGSQGYYSMREHGEIS